MDHLELAGMNLELTSACPFRCPQCYVPLEGKVRELPLAEGIYWINEAHRCGIRYINLSGGETLCYPYLIPLIRECAENGMEASVSLSGALATREKLKELIDAGVGSICISLNGSTEEINGKTRQGYDLAVRALGYLKELGGCTRIINFVLHGNNADDLPEMVKLCEAYEADALVVLQKKPDSMGRLDDVPDQAQLERAAAFISSYKGPVIILPDHCYYELRRLLPDTNEYDAQGPGMGCGAGLSQISVNTQGQLTPCRHLEIPESFPTIEAYLKGSEVIRRIREHVAAVPDWRECMTQLL